jgi:hypothetical protein
MSNPTVLLTRPPPPPTYPLLPTWAQAHGAPAMPPPPPPPPHPYMAPPHMASARMGHPASPYGPPHAFPYPDRHSAYPATMYNSRFASPYYPPPPGPRPGYHHHQSTPSSTPVHQGAPLQHTNAGGQQSRYYPRAAHYPAGQSEHDGQATTHPRAPATAPAGSGALADNLTPPVPSTTSTADTVAPSSGQQHTGPWSEWEIARLRALAEESRVQQGLSKAPPNWEWVCHCWGHTRSMFVMFFWTRMITLTLEQCPTIGEGNRVGTCCKHGR